MTPIDTLAIFYSGAAFGCVVGVLLGFAALALVAAGERAA